MENQKNLIEKGGEIEKYEKFHGKIGGKIGYLIHNRKVWQQIPKL